MTALVVLAIAAVGAVALFITDRGRRRHAHMRRLRYHEDTAWRAFDAAMSKHSKETRR